jgi:hypothetical protein
VLTLLALLVALGSAYYTHEQAKEAKLSRADAKAAAEAQEIDVHQAREAAQRSQELAAELAHSNESIARTQQRGTELAERQFQAFQRAAHGGMQPLLYDEAASMKGEYVEFTIVNKGKMAAHIGKFWCGAGVFVREGSADIAKVLNASQDVFRRSVIVPDETESFELPVFASMPPTLGRANPIWASAKEPLTWLVACEIPYFDELDTTDQARSHILRFCYEIQPQSDGRHAIPCPTDQILPSIRKLKDSPKSLAQRSH